MLGPFVWAGPRFVQHCASASHYDFVQFSQIVHLGLKTMVYTHRASNGRSRELEEVDSTKHGSAVARGEAPPGLVPVR